MRAHTWVVTTAIVALNSLVAVCFGAASERTTLSTWDRSRSGVFSGRQAAGGRCRSAERE